MKTWNRKQKNVARTMAMTPSKGQKPVKLALMMPGKECLCVREGLKTGLFDKDTFILAVEKNRNVAWSIQKQLTELGLKCEVFDCQLHEINWWTDVYYPWFALSDKSCNPGKKIDFAFLDFCGEIKKQNAYWLRENMHRFAHNATIAFTTCLMNRNNHLMMHVKDTVGQFVHEGRLEKDCDWYWFDGQAVGEYWEKKIVENLDQDYYSLCSNSPDDMVYSFDAIALHSVSALLIQKCLLRYEKQKNPRLLQHMIYKDTIPMSFSKWKLNSRGSEVNSPENAIVDQWLSDSSKPHHQQTRKETTMVKQRDCEVLECPVDLTAGQKAAAVRRAKNGIKPNWLKPQQWAWNHLNPKGIRRKK